tara:strand:- start:2151 stop:4286 length:2136 start_codon:yes stop_codon:yes gene_type:complete
MAVRKIDVSATGAPTGYKRGTALETLDWSAISDKLDKEIQAVEQDRENKRTEIKKNSDEMFDTLNNSPLGNHAGRNEALLEYADNAKQAMLMLDRELKSGNISLKDYTVAAQNLKDGTNQIFSIMDDWNTDYDEAMNRMNNCGGDTGIDCSAAQEQFQMMQAEALGKLENHAMYINPTNFKVTLGKREVDENGNLTGGISKNQTDFAEVQQLRNRVKQRINKFDLEGNLNQIEGQLSTMWTEYIRANPGFTVQDARQNPEYKEAKENWINSRMTNAVDVGSMLTDYLKFNPNTGNQYGFTMDPEEAAENEDLILLVNDPERMSSGLLVPDFSTENGKKQQKAAYDLMNTQIEGQLDKIEKPAGTEQQWKSKEGDAKNEAEDYVSNLAKLWTGDNDTVNSVLSTIQGANPDIVDIFVGTDQKLYITKKDEKGNITRIPGIDKGDNAQEFIEAIITHVSGGQDLTNLNKAVANSGLYKGMERGDGVGEFAIDYQEKIDDFNTATKDDGEGGTVSPSLYKISFTDLEDKYFGHENSNEFIESAENILEFLPNDKLQGGTIVNNNTEYKYKNSDGEEVLLDGYSGRREKGASITIFYPELMTAPITIPTYADSSQGGETMQNVYNQIMEDVFNAAKTGQKIRPIDYKQQIDSYASVNDSGYNFDDWNNADLFISMGLIDNAEQWSGGDGVMQPSSVRPSKANQGNSGSGNSMSNF